MGFRESSGPRRPVISGVGLVLVVAGTAALYPWKPHRTERPSARRPTRPRVRRGIGRSGRGGPGDAAQATLILAFTASCFVASPVEVATTSQLLIVSTGTPAFTWTTIRTVLAEPKGMFVS